MLPVKTASPPSVDRAFTILEEVAQSNRGLRLREIALKLGAPRSSTHSLLVALERRGVFTLANAGLKGMALREISHPILAGLMRQTGLTVHMAILDREHAVLIEQIVPPPELGPTTWPGERLELHCTALGKALAAFEPEEHWDGFAGKRALARHNDNTICSRKKFLDELATTCKRGYAMDDEEVDLGVRCLGVPVFGAGREAVAAISVSGTCVEVHTGNAAELVKLLTAAANQIRRALGGNGTAYGGAAPAAT
ncbi:MAG: IclR family transcriptional regulator [Candidatus Solibacter sp.]|nr:IclR family transcriptional regulator [Candidatus Solibacter sp.]